MPIRTTRHGTLAVLIIVLASMVLAACASQPGPTPTAVPTLGAEVAAPAVEENTATPEPAAETEVEAEATAESAEETDAEETPTPEPESTAEAATDSEAPAAEAESVAFNSWTVEQLYGIGTLGSVPVTAEFVSDTQLTGWTGCNDYEAVFETGDGDSIQVTEFDLTSDNPCRSEAAGDQELLLQKALSEAATYELSGAELTLSDAAGNVVLMMRNAAVLTLLDTNWAVTGYNDTQGSFVPVLPDGPALTMILGENVISGFSGCNNYSGTFESSGNQISIDNLANDAAGAGSAACGEAGPLVDQEAAYRKSLTDAATWEIDGPHLTLSGADGNPVVTFLAGPAASDESQ